MTAILDIEIVTKMSSALSAARDVRAQKKRRQHQSIANARANLRLKPSPPQPSSPDPSSDPAPSLRPRPEIVYSEQTHGRPYSQLLGTTSQALQDDVRSVMREIDRLCAGPWHRERFRELVGGVLALSSVAELVEPPPEYRMVANGVKSRLHDMRAASVHRHVHGRTVYNALVEAVAAGITNGDVDARDGRIGRLADLVGVHPASFRRARDRLASCNLIASIDPTRTTRHDALLGDRLQLVLDCWARYTRPEPAVGPRWWSGGSGAL